MTQPIRGIVLVTGTGTGVGKTIVTAAIAAAATAAGLRVEVIKPGQTGDDSDEATVRQLAGPASARTLTAYPDPLAPLAAARVSRLPPMELADVIGALDSSYDLTLVEGAGGLLVPMGPGWTMADFAMKTAATAIVVTRAALGTLSDTALTLEALDRRAIPHHLVLGSWPAEPELVHHTNLADLPTLAGLLPESAGSLDPAAFRRLAPSWLTPALHGTKTSQH
jgi:dethiobiotin synthetase